MNGLLKELANSDLDCHVGSMFAGIFVSIHLNQMAHICERYAQKFDVLFNVQKSHVIVYKAFKVKPPDSCIVINGVRIKCNDNVIHLGHLLTENMYEFNMFKCIDDFNCQCNMFLADVKLFSLHIRNILLQRYQLYQFLWNSNVAPF